MSQAVFDHFPMIGIVRYNAGNRVSVAKALGRLGIDARTVETREELARCDGLIFPGAGAAQSAMRDLDQRGIADALREFDKPFLGICLGMQLLFDFSEEGGADCLGIVRGRVKRLPEGATKPHMGWNRLDTGQYAYFAHSYFCVPDDPRVVATTVRHGLVFCAGLRQGNVFGVQWHPEKSGETGDRLLRSFAAVCRLSLRESSAESRLSLRENSAESRLSLRESSATSAERKAALDARPAREDDRPCA